jgi:hypothetical protein
VMLETMTHACERIARFAELRGTGRDLQEPVHADAVDDRRRLRDKKLPIEGGM